MATSDQLDDLKRLIGDAEFTDDELNEIIDENDENIQASAAVVWESQAASYSQIVDVTESGSSRKMGDLFDNAMKMAEYYRGQTTPIDVQGRTRIAKIVRE
jgi:Cdc6-like AAA superfamily ATPase